MSSPDVESSTDLTSTREESTSSSRLALHIDAFRRVTVLALERRSPIEFLKEALPHVAQPFASPYAALDARIQGQVVTREWYAGEEEPDFWKTRIQALLVETLSSNEPQVLNWQSKESSVNLALFSDVICGPQGSTIGALALVVPADAQMGHGLQLALFRGVLNQVSECLGLIDERQRSAATTQASSTFGTLNRVASYSSKHELAFAVTNNFRNRSRSDLVALGLVTGKKVRILSISGQDEVRDRSPGVQLLRSAMEECLDAGRPVVVQSADGWGEAEERTAPTYLIHKRWHESAGRACVASLPIFREDRCLGILSLRRTAAEPFDEGQLSKFQELVDPYVQSLDLVDRATRGLLAHVKSTSREVGASLFRSGHWLRKAAAVASIVVCGWFIFGSIEYEVPAECVIQPARTRQFATPFDAVLKRSYCVAGDTVRQDEILCEFDRVQLELERNRLEAEREIARLKEGRFLVDGSQIDVELARTELRHVRALLDIVNRKIEQSVVRAPFAGVVVKGDLRTRIGDILHRGEPLFELSTETGWNLELYVREDDVQHIAAGCVGGFASNARPENRQSFAVTRIHPSAEQREGDNVYVVEARTEYKPDWMRSGMEGLAKIEVGPRPVWWTVFHKLINYIRIHLWI